MRPTMPTFNLQSPPAKQGKMPIRVTLLAFCLCGHLFEFSKFFEVGKIRTFLPWTPRNFSMGEGGEWQFCGESSGRANKTGRCLSFRLVHLYKQTSYIKISDLDDDYFSFMLIITLHFFERITQ
jgi:hypothetical protein